MRVMESYEGTIKSSLYGYNKMWKAVRLSDNRICISCPHIKGLTAGDWSKIYKMLEDTIRYKMDWNLINIGEADMITVKVNKVTAGKVR